ncbi:MAG: hypothetical protein R3B93_19985 [Bacteroidia bacterium]
MKNQFAYIILLLTMTFTFLNSHAQIEKSKTGFYFSPQYSAMLMENHVGNAVGFNLGVELPGRHWAVGMRYYGRSGPINTHAEFPLVLENGQTYKGKSTLQLGADHGYIGLEAAYQFYLFDEQLQVRIPASFGQLGAGFYLKGEDRITPDGRRVSEWEDDLQGNSDAGFGLAGEMGLEAFYQPFKELPYLSFGGGAHFTRTFGYTSFLGGDDFYNNKPRLSIGMMFRY